MALEALTDQLHDLSLAAGECVPFHPPKGTAKLDDTPRYLFRVFTPNSRGMTSKTWAMSSDAMVGTTDCKTDIFERSDSNQVANMIYSHLRWLKIPNDNLVSWTSSLLVALVYIFHLNASTTDGSAFENIYICIMDTTCCDKGVFMRDRDLIREYKSYNLDLKYFERLRSRQHKTWRGYFYFGEYISQGALKVEGRCQVVSAQAIIDQNLYELLPGLRNFPQGTIQSPPPWANKVIEIRENFYTQVIACQESIYDKFSAAIRIGELFGRRWRMPVAISLLGLIPHQDSDITILSTLRQPIFTGKLPLKTRHN
ncbi:uncharacterized protein CTRU02_215217 [Colletotrichum truncatum]|uniref:Uncharacterized protein n=1 Tax=Colletotrichum truncatum TaxID=5467 RepID=A0ACC3YDC4_COLTU